MSEDFLKHLSLDELLDLMMQSTKDLVDIINKDKKIKKEYESKRKEVRQLQNFIVAKEVEFNLSLPCNLNDKLN
jgi:hypothetical protein